tara:strand:- start:30 stop:227 length:198 start_codon:yes stop_codon:yes gene_type:complete
MTWIDRARDVMFERGITQQDIADMLGVTRGAVGHWLCGRREPTLSQFIELSDALEVSAGYLLAGE